MKLLVISLTLICSIISSAIASDLRIYSSLDNRLTKPLLEVFQKLYPSITLEYIELPTLEIYERIITESDNETHTADFVFSSAMDLQMKLANDGYARELDINIAAWPDWASWNQTAFALTFEPAVIVFHKPSFKGVMPPNNRAELREWLLNPDHFERFATYDIERAGLGFLFFARDVEHDRNVWELVSAMGQARVKLYSNSSAILERVANGDFDLGYNILGSYALDWATRAPDLGIIYPQDYTVVMSRIGIVPHAAANPVNGQLFLEFLMSKDIQKLMSDKLLIDPVHPNLPLSPLYEELKSSLRPIPVRQGLLAYLDQVKRTRLIKTWNNQLTK